MADIEIRTTVTGVEDSKQKLGELTGKLDDVGKSGATKAKAALKDLAVTLTATAAVASIFARNNIELQENLQGFSLAMAGAGAAVRAFGNVIKLVSAVPMVGIALAIGAIVTATVLLIQNWEAVKATAIAIWSAIGNFLSSVWNTIASAAAALGEIIMGAFTLDTARIKAGWADLAKITAETGEKIAGAAKTAMDATIVFAKKTVDVLTGNELRKRQFAEQTADYEIRTGQATYDKKIALLKSELAASKGNKEEQLRLLNEIAATRDAQAAREIADIKMISGLTKREQVEALELLAEKYKDLGNEGFAAFRKIQMEIQSMSNDWGKVLVGIKDAWTGMFEDIFTSAKTFSEAWSAFWTNIKNIVLKKIADIVSSNIWDSFAGLFKGGGSLAGIGALGGPAMAGIGAALALVVQLGTAEGRAQFIEFVKNIPAIIQEFADNIDVVIDAFIDALPDVIEALVKAAPKIALAITEAILITLPTALIKSAASFIGEILKGAVSFVGELLKGAFNFVAEILKGAVQFIQKIVEGIADPIRNILPGGGGGGSKIGKIIGGGNPFNPISWFAHGGTTTVTRPTLIGVGERGAEMVSVNPLSGGRSGSGINISFSGPVVFDEITLSQWARKLSKTMDHENRRFA